MAGIIKANTPSTERQPVGTVVFNFDDVTAKANAYLTQVKAEAAQILAKANQDAANIRREAERQGGKSAVDAAERTVQTRVESQVKTQMQTVLPAIEQMVQQMSAERLQWLEKWEQNAVQLSVAIAKKIIRRELKQAPQITLELVREALNLAAGSQTVKVYLHPQDHAALGQQAQQLANQLSTTTRAEIVPHPDLSPGGCLVQTEFGLIDQQIESQLGRIAEEMF